MSILTTLINPKRIAIDAVVTKADGTIVNYGTVALYDKNFFKMLCWSTKQALLRGLKRIQNLSKGN